MNHVITFTAVQFFTVGLEYLLFNGLDQSSNLCNVEVVYRFGIAKASFTTKWYHKLPLYKYIYVNTRVDQLLVEN